MATWKINGKPFSDRGITEPRLDMFSQRADEFSFRIPVDAFDDASAFAYGAQVVVERDDDRVFLGRIVSVPRKMAGAESISYVAAGPWWWLDNVVMQQPWKVYGDAGVLTTQNKSRLVIGLSLSGEKITVAQIVREVLDHAIAAGAPIAIGDVEPSMTIPLDEVVDQTCGEVIRSVLRFVPDAQCFFDYATTPPTFHCKRRQSLEALTVDVAGGTSAASVQITERPDLQVPSVVLYYEYDDVVPGEDRVGAHAVRRAFPSGATGIEPGALVATIQLASGSSSHVSQELETEEIDTNNHDWWKRHVPWLADVTLRSIYSVDNPTSKQREIIRGDVADWMTGGKEQVTITAKVAFTSDVDGEEAADVKDQVISVTLTATNAFGGTYVRQTSVTEREPIPEGLEQVLYQAFNQSAYEGELVAVAQEPLMAAMGRVLNFSGGRSEWGAMKALVQSMSVMIETGTTKIGFGPPRHLSPQDFMEMLRANRRRRTTTNFVTRWRGDSQKPAVDGSKVSVPSAPSSGGGGYRSITLIKDGKKIVLDPARLECGETVELQKVTLLTGSGAELRQALVSTSACTDEEAAWELLDVPLCIDGEVVTRKLLALVE